MSKWSRHIKDRASELAEGYQEARDEAFSDEFKIEFSKILHNNEIVTHDDIQGFLNSFTFPEENDWALAQAESELESAEDAKMQLEKDER